MTKQATFSFNNDGGGGDMWHGVSFSPPLACVCIIHISLWQLFGHFPVHGSTFFCNLPSLSSSPSLHSLFNWCALPLGRGTHTHLLKTFMPYYLLLGNESSCFTWSVSLMESESHTPPAHCIHGRCGWSILPERGKHVFVFPHTHTHTISCGNGQAFCLPLPRSLLPLQENIKEKAWLWQVLHHAFCLAHPDPPTLSLCLVVLLWVGFMGGPSQEGFTPAFLRKQLGNMA